MSSRESASSSPLSRAEGPPKLLALFFAAFAAAGLFTSWLLCLAPLTQVVDAQDWVPSECTITRAEVITHEDSDGDTYAIEVEYRYEYGGNSFSGDRYNFSPATSSSGYASKAAIVEAMPPGSVVACWLDPDAPGESVLDKEPGAYMLWGLFPLPFLAVGLGGLIWTLRPRRERPLSQVARAQAHVAEQSLSSDTGPVELRPSNSPWAPVLFLLLFSAIWDAACAFMVLTPDGPPLFFSGIFVLCGLGVTFGALPYTLGKALNPRPVLVLDSSRIAPGDTVQVLWALEGNTSRLRRMTLRLEGIERATYRRGTKTITEDHVFHRDTLFDQSEGDLGQGIIHFTIPAGSMHSFEGGHNAILWQIAVDGDIARWPDIGDRFTLEVLPIAPK